MGQFRSQIRAARVTLHDYMSVPALYFPWPLNGAEPLSITVRVHDKFGGVGDLKGTSLNYAEVLDNSPRAIFMRSEVEPTRNFYFTVEPGVGFRVDAVSPPDDITVTANIIRLRAIEMVGMPTPPAEA